MKKAQFMSWLKERCFERGFPHPPGRAHYPHMILDNDSLLVNNVSDKYDFKSPPQTRALSGG